MKVCVATMSTRHLVAQAVVLVFMFKSLAYVLTLSTRREGFDKVCNKLKWGLHATPSKKGGAGQS